MTHVSTSSVDIRAPRERVWAALTEPALVKQWQYGSDLLTDWQVGEPIRFKAAWQGQTFEQWGTVLAFEPSVSLSYSLFAPRPGVPDAPQNYFTMTYTLDVVGEGVTRLSVTQNDPRPTAEAAGVGAAGGDVGAAGDGGGAAAGAAGGAEGGAGVDPVFVALRELCER